VVTLYAPQENGNLKFLAEVEDADDAAEAVEALLEEQPRIRAEEFVALIGDLEEGIIVTVRQIEQTQTRWSVSANGNGEDEEELEEEEEAPAPRKRGRPKGSTTKPKRGPGRPPKAAAASTGKRGRQATLTEDVLESAVEMHNDQGMTMKEIAEELGVASSGYLAKKIRETFGDDVLGEVKRGRRPNVEAEEAPAPKKRGPGRPKGSITAKRGPGRPKGSTNKAKGVKTRTRTASAKKRTPFAAKSDED